MVQINWTLQAKEDLKSIAKFISRDSVRYAKLQVIRNRTNILKLHIHLGEMVPEIENKKIRELIEGNYRVVY